MQKKNETNKYVDVNSSTTGKEWKHWKRTFQNYVIAFETADNTVDRLQVLTNFLSFHIFEYIDECETYEAAIQKLDSVLMKTPNEVFARHLLATAKQKPGQSLEEFLQELRRLSKDCNFQAVTREQHRDGFLRDAFTNRILYTTIRRRLLEEVTLTIDTAFEKARALDLAQKNSDAYASAEASA